MVWTSVYFCYNLELGILQWWVKIIILDRKSSICVLYVSIVTISHYHYNNL